MNWTQKDLDNLQKNKAKYITKNPKLKSPKPKSKELRYIEQILIDLQHNGHIKGYVSEFKFAPTRRFKFDYAIPEHRVAVEYEGIFAGKSRHTGVTGYTTDCGKYNLAQTLGWKVLRYTALNYTDLEQDLKEIFNNE